MNVHLSVNTAATRRWDRSYGRGMDYTRLGRAGAQVSRIALGTMNFGSVIDEQESFAILDAARSAGVTFIDTADVYGGRPGQPAPGTTEGILGRWIGDRTCRDDVFLATKVYGATGDGANDRGLSALHIRSAVDASLRRLRTDRIDLYQVHHIDRDVHPDEVLEALTLLRDQGKIIYAGSSNHAGWHLARHQERARSRGGVAFATEQSVYNLTRRQIETDVIPAAEAYGMGILPWSPLGGGLLAGRPDGAASRRGTPPPHLRDAVEAYERFAAGRGIRPAVLGLAWLLHQPCVTAPIVGPSRVEQLSDALAALEVSLTSADLEALDEIWPGPGGPAPESYSW